MQRGYRKPHFAYELTPDAERLFPKAYDALLNGLLHVIDPDGLLELLLGGGVLVWNWWRHRHATPAVRLARVTIAEEDGKLVLRLEP